MIRIQNVYYMLSYAFQVLNEQGYRQVATEEFENVTELCASILIKGLSSQIKRGLGKEYITEEDIWTSNINDKAINIKVTDIDINNTSIELDEVYNASAIITVDVKNNGLNDIELANLDVYPYQGSLATKYFVSTYKDEISGFIGNLKSGESKTLKMGVTLHNTKEPIRLEFSDIEDIKNNTIVKTIDIK